jgi:hypothetical protein
VASCDRGWSVLDLAGLAEVHAAQQAVLAALHKGAYLATSFT